MQGLNISDGLTNLRELDLRNTQVTDAGLEKLRGLTKLVELSFAMTQVSDEGTSEAPRIAEACQFASTDTQVTVTMDSALVRTQVTTRGWKVSQGRQNSQTCGSTTPKSVMLGWSICEG